MATIVNPNDPGTINAILATIRKMESGGNYTIFASENTSRDNKASGAYQMIGSTWRTWAAQSGVPGATNYRVAADAPPAMQDAVAAWAVRQTLARYGNNVEAVPASWYVGYYDPNKLDYVPAPEAGNNLTVRSYMSRWMRTYNGGSISTEGAGGGVATAGQTSAGASPPAQQVSPPTDGTIVGVDGKWYLLYEPVPNVRLAYALEGSNVDGSGFQTRLISPTDWRGMNVVMAGSANELASVKSTYGSFQSWFGSILDTLFGPKNPARNDPGILAAAAKYAARPDMSEAELSGLLRSTPYWQTRTDGEREWNDLPDAEKQKKIGDTIALMSSNALQYLGTQLQPSDPFLTGYAEQIASGKKGIGWWIETVLKPAAMADPESPFSRQLRDERKNKLTRGNDIENWAVQVRNTADKWGVQMPEGKIREWATRIVDGDSSEADLLTQLQNQAKILYPMKDPNMETATWAEPWLQTHERVMEKRVDLTNPRIQQALSAGTPVWEFEQNLKRSEEWLSTKNAHEDLSRVISNVGRRMGFV